MNILTLIEKKKNNKPLTEEEIKYAIDAFVNKEIPDYQMSSFVMTIWFNGMNKEEISYFTKAIINTGEIIDLSSIEGIKVDKHSTGGVGDKVSLILSPIIASLGIPVAKMSGRGLGFTGGTIDKLESIPGYRVELDITEFINQVKNIGISIIGQTPKIVPGDKLLYALRDVTGTIDSIPMIAASIMSKKIATGSEAILLDVKCGDAAFMKDLDSARVLGKTMIEIGKSLNKNVRVEITSMDQPLGREIGNKNEVIESIEFLKGNYSNDLKEVIYSSASELLMMANVVDSKDKAYSLIDETINNGKAFEKFKEWISTQGGDIDIIQENSFWNPKYKYEIKATESGYMNITSAVGLGLVSVDLGAGRKVKGDSIDFDAGITLNKKTNEEVKEGDVLITLYSSSPIEEAIINKVLDTFTISNKQVELNVILDKLI